MIQLKGLSKSFGSKEVLQNVNCTFNAGKVYGIVGENGAGKTTLFRCIAALESYSGQVLFGENTLKDHIGFLQTNPKFMSRLTAKEHLRLMLQGRNGREVDIKEKNVFDLPLNAYAENYSTGMKKKLALQAILLQRNELFILDEPFNGVDFASSFLIDQIITTLKKKEKCILLSSHIFSTLKNNCDEILVLKAGTFDKVVKRSDFDVLEKELRQDFTNEVSAKLDF